MKNIKMIKIAVRLDDITPDMDWERFFAFKALLDRYQVKPLIGVVPDNRDETLRGKTLYDKTLLHKTLSYKGETVQKEKYPSGERFWEYLKQLEAEGWIIAMHGCRHNYTTHKGGLFPLNNFSEFAGVPYEEQLAMLKEGRELLKEKGIDTDIFMAPAHSYDKNTLKALKETGFLALTDGFGSMPYFRNGLIFYPISFKLSRTFRKKGGYSTMVIHPGTVSKKELSGYAGYFEKPEIQWISYGEYRAVKPKKRGVAGMTMEFLLALLKRFLVKIH